MKTLLLLLLSTSVFASYECYEDLVDFPPFYVSDEYRQGDKMYENFRNLENANIKDKYIPRGSIVFIDPQVYEQFEGSENGRVPVKVLTTPSEKAENELKHRTRGRSADNIKSVALGTGRQTRVQKNDKGWMSIKSLRSVDQYTFAVEKDSPLYDTPGIEDDRNYYIKLNMENGKFKVRNCCIPDEELPEGEAETCFSSYEMTVIDDDSNELQSNYVNFRECNFFEGSMPIKDNQFDAFRSILKNFSSDDPNFRLSDLEVVPSHQDWRGNTPIERRKELVKVPIDSNGAGPFGSIHYRGDDKANSDAYLKPNALCAFTQVLKKWQQECSEPGCKAMFGDLYHPRSWRSHSTHGSGDCIDLRPFRKNDDDTTNGLKYGWERYSRDKTQRFIELLEKAGGSPIYFNDPTIKRETAATHMRGHDNHIHVCFDEEADKTLETCNNGL
ncbi:hypothetical protein BIY24_03680 [Halobacteriovorax marinus]|uniref:hypothetical protein n=1 Tax=Halobacteriovorax marinus TaxID=97084 RepID=UPI000BC2FE25|nr:hypothetical protein [Halobacteriovorax marinus]ATH07067.1 hypothetical protein BIY24_03680 [Halobacteriovorax marinus]